MNYYKNLHFGIVAATEELNPLTFALLALNCVNTDELNVVRLLLWVASVWNIDELNVLIVVVTLALLFVILKLLALIDVANDALYTDEVANDALICWDCDTSTWYADALYADALWNAPHADAEASVILTLWVVSVKYNDWDNAVVAFEALNAFAVIWKLCVASVW